MEKNKSYPIILAAVLLALFVVGLFSNRSTVGFLDKAITELNDLVAVIESGRQVAQVGGLGSSLANASAYQTLEQEEVDLANKYGQWLRTESQDYISLNFSDKYDTSLVTDLSKYSITSIDDPNYATAQNPTSLGYRWRAIFVPITENNLIIAYRLFLKLPHSLKDGASYTVTVGDIGIAVEPFSFTFDDDKLNENIHLNQVGYLPNATKIAYLGQYLGTDGPMPFSANKFEVRSVFDGALVYTNDVVLEKPNNPHSGHNIYALDFSNLKTKGYYFIKVPGVGVSFPFRVASDVYNEIFANAMLGSYHQRASTELTSDYTRFTHGPAHMEDAYVMPHNPIASWFKNKYGDKAYYPSNLSGQFIDATKGHYDAGDYGKYVVNGAYYISFILNGYDAFPEKLTSDAVGIPESGNGIPDIIDEVKWELDWVENMQDPDDGGVFCIIKPDGAVQFYENNVPDYNFASDRVFYAKDTVCTAAFAAALAKASASDSIRQYYPEVIERYKAKALKAWNFLEQNAGYLCWHHYGCQDNFNTDVSLDDRVWAALELYKTTGTAKFHDYFVTNHNPEYRRWSWVRLFSSAGQATISCALSRVPLDQTMKQRCINEVVSTGDKNVTDSQTIGYGLSLDSTPFRWKDIGWFFFQLPIYQLLIANELSPKADYIETALTNWNYILGANPLGYSYQTGLGDKRLRNSVSTQTIYDDIVEPMTGVIVGLSNSFSWLSQYGSLTGSTWPAMGRDSVSGYLDTSVSYPLLMSTGDAFNINSEFTVPNVAQNLIISAYFSDLTTNQKPTINSLQVQPTTGTVPLSVNFSPDAVDADGEIVDYFYDFGDGEFSYQPNPTHVYSEPFKLYKGALTVTDNDGRKAFIPFSIQTGLATDVTSYEFQTQPYTADENTLALFHLDGSLAESTGKGYTFVTSGNARFDSSNLLWMSAPSGQALRLTGISDVVSVALPRKVIWPDDQSVVTVEAKIYPNAYTSDGVNKRIFSFYQSWNVNFGLTKKQWTGILEPPQLVGYKMNIINGLKTIAETFKVKSWNELKFIFANGQTSVYINNQKVGEATSTPSFALKNDNLQIISGEFDGWIDEIRVSNVARLGLTPDDTAPTSSISPAPGNYTSTQSVLFACVDAAGCSVYYCTTPNCTPNIKYNSAINLNTSTTFRYRAVDTFSNQEAIKTAAYSIAVESDTTPPTTTTTLVAGNYNSAQVIGFTRSEIGTTYYCLESGCVPNLTYNGSLISISSSTIVRYYSVDTAGNEEGIKTATYTITLNNIPTPLPDNGDTGGGTGDTETTPTSTNQSGSTGSNTVENESDDNNNNGGGGGGGGGGSSDKKSTTLSQTDLRAKIIELQKILLRLLQLLLLRLLEQARSAFDYTAQVAGLGTLFSR